MTWLQFRFDAADTSKFEGSCICESIECRMTVAGPHLDGGSGTLEAWIGVADERLDDGIQSQIGFKNHCLLSFALTFVVFFTTNLTPPGMD